jgi:hypothetical protein
MYTRKKETVFINILFELVFDDIGSSFLQFFFTIMQRNIDYVIGNTET